MTIIIIFNDTLKNMHDGIMGVTIPSNIRCTEQ